MVTDGVLCTVAIPALMSEQTQGVEALLIQILVMNQCKEGLLKE